MSFSWIYHTNVHTKSERIDMKVKSIISLLLIIPSLLFSQVDFCVFTWPKCGTHLLTYILGQITSMNAHGTALLNLHENLDFVSHVKEKNGFPYTHIIADWQFDELIEKNYKFIFIYRDPRDQIVSYAYWIDILNEVHPHYPLIKLDIPQRIEELITGQLFGKPMYEAYDEHSFKKSNELRDYVLSVRFEDLIGPNGGGSLEKQVETILKIAKFLDFPLTMERAEEISNKSWGNSFTFRKGTIGQWKEYFTPKDIQLYKERYGALLIEIGYEKDLNW